MKAARRSFLWIAVVPAAMLGASCKGGAPPPPSMPPPEVTVSRPVEREVRDWFETTGRIEPVEMVEVRARVSGYLVSANVEDGAEVKAGDVLFEIDPRPYQAALLQAEADLARWEATRKKSQADVERNRRLRPEGAASERDLETAVWSAETAEAEIKAARARVEQARLDVGFTKVTAPVSGRVSRRNVTVGNLIQVGAGNSGVLTVLVSVDPLYVAFDVDERTLLRYQEYYRQTRPEVSPDHVSQLAIPVEIGLANEKGYSRTATVDFVDNRVDPSTGTLRVRGILGNPDRSLTPGLFVRVRTPFGEPERALLVPEIAIGSDQSTKYLLAVNPQNVVTLKTVELGPLGDDGLRVVRRGLGADDRIIVNGLMKARPGSPVSPHEPGAPASPAATPAG